MSADESDDEPMIQFAGEWIPAHAAWKKMETATVVADHIARFNEGFPHLANHRTRDVVPVVRQRLKDINVRAPKRKPEKPDIKKIATDLLESMSPEDVLDTLAAQHDEQSDMTQLVGMVGEKAYLQALQREAEDFRLNGISPEQNAQLWNEMARPVPGGGLWSARKVSDLSGQPAK